MESLLELTRISTDDTVGTFGVLKWASDAAPFALSLEDPWKNNERNVSCIPAGSYLCERYLSPTHGSTFIVTDVPGRSFILFHKGNTHLHTQGCILVGEEYGFIDGVSAVLNSGKGFQEFLKKLEGKDKFKLDVLWTLSNRPLNTQKAGD